MNAVKSCVPDERPRARVAAHRGRAGGASAAPGRARARCAPAAPAPGSSRRGWWRRGGRRSRPRRHAREHRDVVGQQRVERRDARRLALVARDLAPGVDAGVGAAGHRQRDRGARSTTRSARSSSSWTVRWPGCRAQPANAVPSYSIVQARRQRRRRGDSDQLEQHHLGRVRPPRAELQDPRVAAGPLV